MMVAEQHDAGPRVDRTRRARRGAVTDVAAARLAWPAFGLAALALVPRD
ncbi:MAG TPA: hypothetical protein VFA00_13110 [Actinomycetota bacterium]|jgi:hypothetical protein|nr:hypothetical protein [Actinomycetota bacterium]